MGGVAWLWLGAARCFVGTPRYAYCNVFVQFEYRSSQDLRLASPPRSLLPVVLDRKGKWSSTRRGGCKLTAPPFRKAATPHCSTNSNFSVVASRRRSKIGTPHTSKAGHCKYVAADIVGVVGGVVSEACLRRIRSQDSAIASNADESRTTQTECAKALDKVREIRRQADGLQKRNQELLEQVRRRVVSTDQLKRAVLSVSGVADAGNVQRQGEEKLSSDKGALKKALKEQVSRTGRKGAISIICGDSRA